MSILYSSNAKFPSTGQKSFGSKGLHINSDHLLPSLQEAQPVLPIFKSEHSKDSNKYLLDLCYSIYPNSLHDEIKKINEDLDLQVHALVALVIKNYVTHWYGSKVPTDDVELFYLLLGIIQEMIDNAKNTIEGTNPDFEKLLMDDLPFLIADHLQALNSCKHKQGDIFSNYCMLTCYDKTIYPRRITRIIKKIFNSKLSTLQNTFLDSLFDDFLLGKMWGTLSHPYFLLDITNKYCKTLQKKNNFDDSRYREEDTSIAIILTWFYGLVYRIFQSIFIILTIFRKKNKLHDELPLNGTAIHRYIFNFLLIDIFQLNDKRPIIYFIWQIVRYLISNIVLLSNTFQSNVNSLIYTQICTKNTMKKIFIKIRHTLFPNDWNMGAKTEIPVGEEWSEFKAECVNNVWNVIKIYNLHKIQSLTKNDISEAIELISCNQACNEILYYRLLDCLLANCSSS